VLSHLDDSPWHQLPTTFDHVGTSDVRFFDRLWFAASDRVGSGALQFTMGVYQNMNVVDAGFVAIHRGRQHNVRASRQLRPAYEMACGPLGIDVIEPLAHVRLAIDPSPATVHGELEWVAAMAPQEERHHFSRLRGRVTQDYSRYDQIGDVSGWVETGGARLDVAPGEPCVARHNASRSAQARANARYTKTSRLGAVAPGRAAPSPAAAQGAAGLYSGGAATRLPAAGSGRPCSAAAASPGSSAGAALPCAAAYPCGRPCSRARRARAAACAASRRRARQALRNRGRQGSLQVGG